MDIAALFSCEFLSRTGRAFKLREIMAAKTNSSSQLPFSS